MHDECTRLVIVRDPQVLSDCERYEYTFRRVWNPDLPLSLWIMLNPSMITPLRGDHPTVADGPTVRRCAEFARKWGCGGIVTGNVFAYRATKPKDLRSCDDPVGPDNDEMLTRLLDESKVVVAAWGASFPSRHAARVGEVRDLLRARGAQCLGTTSAGHPRHPLYVAGITERVPL